jgi:ADP-ribose pyrophosphatase YjhB (NUDIX family)
MRKKGAVGVVWHGAELAMQERRAADGHGSEVIYTFPGDEVNEKESPAETVGRVLKLEVGFPFSRESLDQVKVLRDARRVVSFYEVRAPYGSLSLRQTELSKMVLMSPYRVIKALQDDMVAELSAEYISRYL